MPTAALLLMWLLVDAPPRVAIAVPTTSSTVSRTVHVRGDLEGEAIKTELLVNGTVAASGKGGKEFALTWDSARASRGLHTLTVRAYDKAGRVGTACVQVHLRAEFDVQRFGAKGDGKADDTAALGRALDAARKSGGTVYLPRGTYLLRPNSGFPFAVGSNVEVRGDGPASILKIADDAGDYDLIFGQYSADPARHADHVDNVSFRHFRVDQNPTGNKAVNIREDGGIQNVFQFYGFRNLTVQDVQCDPEPGVQAIVAAGPKADGVTVDGCSFRFVRGTSQPTPQRGRYYDHSSVYTEAAHVLVRNNVFHAEKRHAAIAAVEVHGGPHVTVAGNQTDGFQVGLIVVNSTADYPEVPEGHFTLRNNRIQNTTQGISLWSNTGRTLRRVLVRDNAITMARHELYRDVWLGILLYENEHDLATRGAFEGLEISGNTIDFRGLPAGAGTAVGIDLAPAGEVRDVTVRQNLICDCPATGIRLGNARARNTLRNVLVEQNTLRDAGCNPKAADRSRVALLLEPATLLQVRVEHNRIEDTGKPGTPRGRWAIRATPGPQSREVAVRHNRVTPAAGLRTEIDSKLVITADAQRP